MHKLLALFTVFAIGCTGVSFAVSPSDVSRRDAGPDRPRDGGRDASVRDAASPVDASWSVDAARAVDATRPDAFAADAGSGAGSPLGTVTVLDTTCAVGSFAPTRTVCRDVRVTCPGLAPIDAQVRETSPAPSAVERGTIIVGTGGTGTSFYATGSGTLLTRLSNAGFRVVDRQWASPWESGSAGMAAQSCRYATLATWVHDHLLQSGALCATGNSGGSAEIAYALSHWDRETILDFAVLTGGPPMSRLDVGCLHDDPSWDATCRAYFRSAGSCAAPSCVFTNGPMQLIDSAYAPDRPCATRSGPRVPDLALDGNLTVPGVDLAYRTPLHFVFGSNDCTEALPFGMAFRDAVTSPVTSEVAASTPHAVESTTAGQNAIFSAMTTSCR